MKIRICFLPTRLGLMFVGIQAEDGTMDETTFADCWAADGDAEALDLDVLPPTGNVEWISVAYRQYGKWSITAPFATREEAERHVKRYLSDNSVPEMGVPNTNGHKKDITYLSVYLPE